MRTTTDKELLAASGRGDREAFTLLARRHHRAIISFVERFLANEDHATAEDLAQDVLLSAWKYATSFQPRAKVVTWLFRITTNACLNFRREERSRVRGTSNARLLLEEARHDDGGGLETELVEDERAQHVRTAIASLPANQRAAIILRHFHEFSYAEIASVLGTSVSAVDSLLHRARRALAGSFGRE